MTSTRFTTRHLRDNPASFTLWGTSLSFTHYHVIRIKSATMKEDKNGDGNAWALPMAQLISGGVSGFASTFACHPFEIIKVRLQG